MSRGDCLPALSLIGQGLLQVLWYGLLHPSATLPVGVTLAIALAPLLALLWVRRQGTKRILLVDAIVVYFAHGVMEAVANPPQRRLALVAIAFAIGATSSVRHQP